MSPTPSPGIEGLRKDIDRIDDQLLSLLNQRARIALEVGRLKAAAQPKKPELHVSEREKSIIERLGQINGGPLPPASIEAIFNEVFKTCLNLQK